MGPTIDLLLCGYKGAEVLKSICSDPRSTKLVRQVIAAEEKIDNNRSFEILKNLCDSRSIPFSNKNEYTFERPADYRLVIGWRWLIPYLEKTIVLHDSLLPAYRGFSPLVSALIEGENNIGATAFYADHSYDSGAIISQKSITIIHPIRIKQALGIMAELYSEIVEEIFSELVKGKIPTAEKQNDENATYSLWRDNEDYFIDWSDDAEKVLRTIYALSEPYEGAQTWCEGRRVVVNDAAIVEDLTIINRTPGKVIMLEGEVPVVVCGRGLIKINEAVYADDGISILPLKKFRVRFGSRQ